MTVTITDGESGESVRSKLNALLNIHGFSQNAATTTGLTFGLNGGSVLFDANVDVTVYAAGTVTLLDDAINVLVLCPDLGSQLDEAVLVFDANDPTPSLPVSALGLYNVTTVSGAITSIVDNRTSATTAYLAQGILSDYSFVKSEDNEDGTSSVTLKNGVFSTITGPKTPTRIVQVVNGANAEDTVTNYVEFDGTDGLLYVNQSAYTPGRLPLCTIYMVGTTAYKIDDRAFLFWPGGASGSFATADKTVTVVSGIITAIDPL